MRKNKYSEYDGMTLDELKQELYKLRYELATCKEKSDIKRFSKAYSEIKKRIANLIVEEKLTELEQSDQEKSLEEKKGTRK